MTITKTLKLAAVAVAAASLSTAAVAGQSNNASAGNDRTMTTQYSRTLLPIGGTSGESNRYDQSYWTGVTTKVPSKHNDTWYFGSNDRDYYSRDYYSSWNGTKVSYPAYGSTTTTTTTSRPYGTKTTRTKTTY